jgi:predicted PurR-regulated permease PerM
MPKKTEISYKTIVFTVFFLLFIWFLYTIKDLILEFFVALLIMAILNPLVNRLSRLKVPRTISVLASFLLVFGIIGVAIAGVIPPLIEQTTSFANNLPGYIENLGLSQFVDNQVTAQLLSQIGTLPEKALKFGISLFSNFFAVLSVVIFSFYLLLARDKLDDQLGFFFGEQKKRGLKRLIDTLEARLGGWARGQLALMALVGVSNFVGLSLLGVPFALPLAILAGILEIIPYFGPIVAALPAVVIGLTISPVMGLAVAALALLIQQAENYIFVPKVMEKSAGVNPIITLLALSIGFRLVGIVGAIISVPAVLTIQVLTRQYLLKR